MREIKFRVWDEQTEAWFPTFRFIGILERNNCNCNVICLANGIQERFKVEQFTGLKDKNGKEIYEGDIVKFQWERGEHDIEQDQGEVFFNKGIFLFGRHVEFATNDSNFLQKTLEVIGNVHENPELLN